MKRAIIILAVLFAVILSGCTEKGNLEAKLKQLKAGMTKEQVVQSIGIPDKVADGSFFYGKPDGSLMLMAVFGNSGRMDLGVIVHDRLRLDDEVVIAQQCRNKVHAKLLRDILDRFDSDQTAADEVNYSLADEYLSAIEFADHLMDSGQEYVVLAELFENKDMISSGGELYSYIMHCVDQVALTEDHLSKYPMVKYLFFDNEGALSEKTIDRLGIWQFLVIGENEAYSRIDTKKLAEKKVPLKWLNEDSCWFLMREYVLSGDKSKYAEAEKLIQKIETFRLAKDSDNKSSSTSTIGRLLSKLKTELNKRK